MRCLSCQEEVQSTQLKIFDKLLLCLSCHALADKAHVEIDREIDRARVMTMNWLQQHIMKGGLLRGSSDGGLQRQAEECVGSGLRNVLSAAEVSGLRGAPGREIPSNRDPQGNSSGPL